MPGEKGTAPTRHRWPSSGSDPGTTGNVMPKTVKSGVVTKRSSVPVTQDKYLEVKLNATGKFFAMLYVLCIAGCNTYNISLDNPFVIVVGASLF